MASAVIDSDVFPLLLGFAGEREVAALSSVSPHIHARLDVFAGPVFANFVLQRTQQCVNAARLIDAFVQADGLRAADLGSDLSARAIFAHVKAGAVITVNLVTITRRIRFLVEARTTVNELLEMMTTHLKESNVPFPRPPRLSVRVSTQLSESVRRESPAASPTFGLNDTAGGFDPAEHEYLVRPMLLRRNAFCLAPQREGSPSSALIGGRDFGPMRAMAAAAAASQEGE
mmetsp:Transcript_25082/g.51905  ORF Transcript_25082/g.51905 Transcript_25082/m.51905 type:complete len:230 (-) Transcript_25082:100-789(-)